MVKTHIVYDEESLSMVDVDTYHYHNSCPLYTYLKDSECYAEPINKGRLSIFPKWNQTSSQLDWILTLEHSSMISKDVIQQLDVHWNSKDPSMQILLDRAGVDSPNYMR